MRFELVLAIAMIISVSIVLFTIVVDKSAIASVTTIAKKPVGKIIVHSKFPNAPQLVGITEYINTTPKDLQLEMKGKVILYNFWTWSCINCIHEIPYVNSWYEKYEDRGLLVIGIHTPEAASVSDPVGIKAAVIKDEIKYPVVLDTNFQTWNAFGNHYWPRAYLADSTGHIVYDHIGEGDYDLTEKKIQELLAQRR